MKKFRGTIAFLGFWLLAFPVLQSQISIDITAKGWENKNILLAYYLGDKQYILNSPEGSDPAESEITLDANGYTRFTAEDLKPGIYLLVLRPGNRYFEFVYEGKDMAIAVDANNNSIQVANSKANDLMGALTDLNNRLRQVDERKKADPNFDEKSAKNSLYEERVALMEKVDREDPDNLFRKMLSVSNYPPIPSELSGDARFYYSREHFFDHIDFTQDWLLHTPLFTNKVNEYFERMTPKQPDSMIVSIDKVLSLAEPNKQIFQYLLVEELNKYAKTTLMGFDAVYVHLVNTYYRSGKADWITEEERVGLLSAADRMEGTLLGDTAGDFSYVTTEGASGSVLGINSGYTLLFFMDPHCKNCIEYSKQLIELKDQIPAEVTVLGVAMNTDQEEMKQLKQERGYFWTIGLLKDEDAQFRVQEDYDVRNFPKILLLDGDKKILAKSLDFAQTFDYLGKIRNRN